MTDAVTTTSPQTGDATIRPFQIDVAPEAVDDLRRRIAATRWPEPETVTDDSQGVPLALMQELDRGGHFAAWEQPTLFSEEMRVAFRSLR